MTNEEKEKENKKALEAFLAQVPSFSFGTKAHVFKNPYPIYRESSFKSNITLKELKEILLKKD